MPVTKSYERYESVGECNVVASSVCNIRALDAHCAVVGANQHVRAYNLRTADTLYDLAGSSAVQCVCLGGRLAAGYADGSVRVFGAGHTTTIDSDEEAPPPLVFQGHRTAVSCLSFAPDQLTLASGGKDCAVILWDIVSEAGLYRLIGHKGAITKMQFTKDNRFLLTSSKDTFIKFWCLASQSCFFTLADHRSEVYDFVLLRDDSRLVCGSAESSLRVYKLTWTEQQPITDQAIRAIQPITDQLQPISDQPPATQPISEGTQQANLYVHCVYEGVVLRQSKGRTVQLCVSTDQALLVAIGTNPQYDVFRMFTAEETTKRIRKKLRHARKQLADGEQLPDGFEDAIRMDFSTQISRLSTQKLSSKIKSVDFVPDQVQRRVDDETELQYRLYAVLANNSIECVTMSTLKSGELSYATLQSPCSLAGHRTPVRAAAFSHDGYALLTASQEAVKIWNRHSLRCVSTMVSESAVLCAVFVLGDRHCVVGTKTGAIYIYDVSSGQCVEQLEEAHLDALNALCLNADSTKCMTASSDKTLKIWHFELKTVNEIKQVTLSERRSLQLPDECLCASWSSKDTYLVTGLLNNNCNVYFADSFKSLMSVTMEPIELRGSIGRLTLFLTLHGHSLPVMCCSVSSDESLVVTGSADKNIKIWGLDFGDCRKSLFAHDAAVTNAQFVPNTQLLFSTGKDSRLKMWDAQSHQHIVTYKDHTDELWCLQQSADGKRLVTASNDGCVRLWAKGDTLVVLEEERQQQVEQEMEDALTQAHDVVPGEVPDAQVGIAAKRNILTIKSAESLIDAIEIVRTEKLEAKDEGHKPHALLQAMNVTNLDHFLADTLRRVRSSDLERCLLLVPHGFIVDVLQALTNCVQDGYQLELSQRVLLFLCKANYYQLAENEEAALILDRMSQLLPEKVCKRRTRPEYHLNAFRFLPPFWELHVQYARRQRITSLLNTYFAQTQVCESAVPNERQSLVFKRLAQSKVASKAPCLLDEPSTSAASEHDVQPNLVRSKMNSEPCNMGSTNSLMYRTEEFEIYTKFRAELLLRDWCVTANNKCAGGARPCHGTCDWCSEVRRLYFVAFVDRRPIIIEPANINTNHLVTLNDACSELALRRSVNEDECVEVLFSCRQTDFAQIAFLWADQLLRYKRIFPITQLHTVFIGQDLEAATTVGSKQITPRTPIDALERLCMDDIVAARNLSETVLADFLGASDHVKDDSSGVSTCAPSEADTVSRSESANTLSGMDDSLVLRSVALSHTPASTSRDISSALAGPGTKESSIDPDYSITSAVIVPEPRRTEEHSYSLHPVHTAHVSRIVHSQTVHGHTPRHARLHTHSLKHRTHNSHTADQLDNDTSIVDSRSRSLPRNINKSRSMTLSDVGTQCDPIPETRVLGNVMVRGKASASVNDSDQSSYSLSLGRPNTERDAQNRGARHGPFRSSRRDSVGPSSHRQHYDHASHRVCMSLSPAGSLTSLGSRLSLVMDRTNPDATSVQGNTLLVRRYNRRRASTSRAASSNIGPQPPNFLIYLGDKQELKSALLECVQTILPEDSYTVYVLNTDQLCAQAWTTNTVCLLIAHTGGLDDRSWQVLQSFVQKGGRILFLCRNSLLKCLTESNSHKQRVQMITMAASSVTLGKDFAKFLKRISKQLKKDSVYETFTSRDMSSQQSVTVTATRQNGSALLLCVQNGHQAHRCTAVFSDASLETVLAQTEGGLLREALRLLHIETRAQDCTAPALTPGYWLVKNVRERASGVQEGGSVCRQGRSLHWHSHQSTALPSATDCALPVIMDCDWSEAPGFAAQLYYAHLHTAHVGRQVLYVPVLISTQHWANLLMLGDFPNATECVVIAAQQLGGKGRSGNQWLSPQGCAMFSIGYSASVDSQIGRAPAFVQHLMALAVCDAICTMTGYQDTPLRIKWPNDIYFGREHKMGGVLVECSVINGMLHFVIGCGVNVSNSRPTLCINDLLSDELRPLQVEQVIGASLSTFEHLLTQFQQSGSTSMLSLYYNYWLHSREEVRLGERDEQVVIRGLDEHGYLSVRSKHTGRMHSLHPDGNSFDMMRGLLKAK